MNVYVASGVLHKRLPGMAVYYVDEGLFGGGSTGMVNVVYNENSVPTQGVPERAILILQQRKRDPVSVSAMSTNTIRWLKMTYDALGGDAYRGILVDNPRNRERILSVNIPDIGANPSHKWLPEADAERLAKQALLHQWGIAGNARTRSIRRSENGYGWVLVCSRGTSLEHFIVYVGDDGVVKDIGVGE